MGEGGCGRHNSFVMMGYEQAFTSIKVGAVIGCGASYLCSKGRTGGLEI